MLENLPDDILGKVASLKGDKRFDAYMEFISDQSLKLAVSSTHLEGSACKWQQGASKVLCELIEQIMDSREVYEKVSKNKRGA